MIPSRSAIAIIGATCSGKTATSIALSRLLESEIISADSRQLYCYLTIGTAKPSEDELSEVPHHFIDILTPNEPYSAGRFSAEATIVAHDILNRDKVPLIVGGSGLYISALCEGIFSEHNNADYSIHRSKLESRLASEGIEQLYCELTEIDPISAKKYSDQNPRRIIRALEYYYANGIPFSEAHSQSVNPKIPFTTHYFGIEIDRAILYEHINQRCIEMWNNGLVEETEHVLSMGYSRTLNSLNTVGYKEALCYISGTYTREQALQKMQQSTRNYAKRQLTWFRRNPNISWLSGNPAEIARQIFNQLNSYENTL